MLRIFHLIKEYLNNEVFLWQVRPKMNAQDFADQPYIRLVMADFIDRNSRPYFLSHYIQAPWLKKPRFEYSGL